MAEYIDQGMIRNTAPIRKTTPFEIGDPLVLLALTKFVHESGFPAACFGDNPHDLTLPRFDLGK
jgi:hypothetical protein